MQGQRSVWWALFAVVAVTGCAPGAEEETEDAADAEDAEVSSTEQALFGGGHDTWWSSRRAVYVMDNVASRNAIVRFRRGYDGSLERSGTFPTGGLGTGSGLGSQNAIVLDRKGRRLFAVNAGSDEISYFEVYYGVLVLRDIVRSGGANPISLTVHDDLLYVVNAGRGGVAANIAGYRIGDTLEQIAGSEQPLSSAAPAPAQIEFAPSGDVLVVTEKASDKLTTYLVDASGRAAAPVVTASSGQTPFGFGFDKRGTLIVSEAFGGAPGASALSSYRLDAAGVPIAISESVPTEQTAACWIALGRGDRFAYTTNTASNTVSGYTIGTDGSLTRFADGGVTATTAAGPTDMDFTDDRRFLFVLGFADGAIEGFRARADGSLEARTQVDGLPTSSSGLAAR